MKILFCWRQYHQSVGGVERMSIELMNEMHRRGYEISLISWDRAEAQPYYCLDRSINWMKLDLGDFTVKASMALRLKRMMKIRKFVKKTKPDVIIAFMDGIFLTIRLSIFGLGIPVMEAERVSPARFKFIGTSSRKIFVYYSLRMAERITVQLESYRNQYPAFLRERIVSIPNPVFQPVSLAQPAGIPDEPKILLSVGRISYQKNYSILIYAFSKLAHKYPNWNLVIAGDGEERPMIEKIISDLGLQKRITLLGSVENVEKLYTSAHLFCLPSRWEGFPNALAEALAHGLPSIGFEDCLGVKDLIDHNKSGLLARGTENIDSLTSALDALMADPLGRESMGKYATQSMKKYAPTEIFNEWEKLFRAVANMES